VRQLVARPHDLLVLAPHGRDELRDDPLLVERVRADAPHEVAEAGLPVAAGQHDEEPVAVVGRVGLRVVADQVVEHVLVVVRAPRLPGHVGHVLGFGRFGVGRVVVRVLGRRSRKEVERRRRGGEELRRGPGRESDREREAGGGAVQGSGGGRCALHGAAPSSRGACRQCCAPRRPSVTRGRRILAARRRARGERRSRS